MFCENIPIYHLTILYHKLKLQQVKNIQSPQTEISYFYPINYNNCCYLEVENQTPQEK